MIPANALAADMGAKSPRSRVMGSLTGKVATQTRLWSPINPAASSASRMTGGSWRVFRQTFEDAGIPPVKRPSQRSLRDFGVERPEDPQIGQAPRRLTAGVLPVIIRL